jgi:hypothetical protein
MGEDLTTRDRLHLTYFYPEPDGEFLHQSKTIIGAADSPGNLSEGYRTTRVISVTI